MKKTLVAVVCSATLVLPSFAFAQEQTNTVQIEVTQPQVELSTVFNTDDVTNLQVATLSETEMKETEGAWIQFAAGVLGGGAFGAWTNHGIAKARTGQWASTRSTLAATGGGMIGGGYSNLMLRGAGIATNPFSRSAWKGTNGVMNGVIRGKGAGLGFSYSGVHGKK